MKPINLNIPLPSGMAGRIRARLPEIAESAVANGITLTYHADVVSVSGSFSGKVSGKFVLREGTLDILITDKPMLATTGLIESKIKGFFGI